MQKPFADAGLTHETHVRLRSIGDLFNSLDPSPLVERDLNDTVEDYLVDSAKDAPAGARLALVLHIPASSMQEVDLDEVTASVANYFRYLNGRQARRIRNLMHEGRQALAIGLLFLIVCILLGQAAASIAPGAVGATLREGLLIIGWVANWRPVEIFLYDWRPMRRSLRIYERLSRLEVVVKPVPAV